MRTSFIFLFLILFQVPLWAQQHTISGYVEDANSGERLLGASVFNPNKPSQGTITNAYGFFSLTLPEGETALRFSFIGYQNQLLKYDLQTDKSITVKLASNTTLDEVVVKAKRTEVESTQMSRVDVPVTTIQKIPALLGEVDIMKTIQLLPGVQGGTEGSSGIYVRGGGPDQNLILLDGVPVYNANHLFGFFSVFNSSAISSVSLTKGGFPARYGGRMSSVIDIRMKEGNMKKFKGEFSIGLISSKLTLEGPIIKDKTSFIVSGRRTYIDILAAPFILAQAKADGADNVGAGYFFHDFNAKINHKFSDRDRLYLSFYTGLDRAYASEESEWGDESDSFGFNLDWGNYTTALRWNHVFNPKLFSNTTLTFSKYRFNVENEMKFSGRDTEDEWKLGYYSGITDLAARIDFQYNPNVNHTLRFGLSGINHTFRPGISSIKVSSSDLDDDVNLAFGDKNLLTQELDAYIEDELRITDRLKGNVGLHFSTFFVRDKSFFSVQPRASFRYLLNNRLSLKASFATMQQYLHLLTSSTVGLPTDLWLPATDKVLPKTAHQVALGTVYQLSDAFNLSVEGFYKKMENLIEYKDGASFFDILEDSGPNETVWENKITQGQGWAYGLELLLKKDIGKLRGWLGYTLSWTNRQFDEISYGKTFPYRYDRRHDINLMMTYQLSKKVDFALTWVYGTGNAVTLTEQSYMTLSNSTGEYLPTSRDYGTVEYFPTRNNFRAPAYHRLDFGVNFNKQKKHGYRTWTIGVYNLYNRKNPFFLNVERRWTGETSKRRLVQYSLFPIIPSFSYKYKF